MKDRREYEKALEIIGGVIRAWDPYSLIALGAPANEFDDQIAKITAGAVAFRSPSDVARAISAVFSASLGPDSFSVADCSEPAQQIFTALGRANLLSAA